MILPSPGNGFEWRETPFGPALVCTALETFAPHLFTTRAWTLGQKADAGEAGWVDVAAAFGLGRALLLRLRQVHGAAACVAESIDRPAVELPQGDILVSGDDAVAIAVQAADCVPLLAVDRRRGVVAAAHAGWRGLAAGVPGETVRMLASTYGSRPADLVVALGPSIGACCYEVGAEVRQAFVTGGFDVDDLQRWFRRAPAPTSVNRSMPGVTGDPRPGQYFFDGWASAGDQLRAAGVADERIFSAALCTASHPELLPSYRRDGRAAGRIAAAIVAAPRRA